jgi:trigger factor
MFEHNHIPELVQEIRRGKALAQIVESATVTDASGNAVELKNLRPDGTIGEPAEESTGETVEEIGDEAGETPVEVVDEPTTDAARL